MGPARGEKGGLTGTIYLPPLQDGLKMLRAWSYSRLTDFEQCKYRVKLKHVDRIPEPARPLPPGKSEHANDRGTRIHSGAELYIKGGVELLPELSSFEEEFAQLRTLHDESKVSVEGEWGYNDAWEPVAWNSEDCWLRMKLDALVWLDRDYAAVIDFKTGRLSGKEVKYNEQMQLYQLAAFLRYPELKRITVELWLTDENNLVRSEYTRAQGLRFLKAFQKRGSAIIEETEFKPNPNVYSCKWCPYKDGICQHAVNTAVKRRPPIMKTAVGTGGFTPWD